MEIGGKSMSNLQLDKDKLAIGAKQLLSNPILQMVFEQITEELITSIFAAKDGDRDRFSHYKQGLDLFVLKLKGYINEVDIEKHQNEKNKKADLTLL
jgi:hypothetical protein